MSKIEINNNLYHSAVACWEASIARKEWDRCKRFKAIVARLNELYDKSIFGR